MKKASKKSSVPKKKVVSVTVKMLVEDKDAVWSKALKFARGNFSAWVRHSAKSYQPREGERIKLKVG